MCPGRGCCWAGTSPHVLRWKCSFSLWVHPKEGRVWGLWVPELGAAPVSWMGDGEDLHLMGHKAAPDG